MSEVSIFALGGLGEIGKNMYVVQYEEEIIVIDSGVKFPNGDMPGIDLIIPNFTYLVENQEKIKGIFLTHGHEDHIGALPFVLKQIQVPVYGAALTIALVKSKLKEHRILRESKLNEINSDSHVVFNQLTISFFATNHTIPDSLGVVVHTPLGDVVHTGDFKFDFTPIGKSADFSKMAQLGEQQQVLALLSDSTNSERSGGTPSERVVGDSIDDLFYSCSGRILFATFASNVYRIKQVVDAAKKYGRKVATIGRSMEKVFEIAQELGHLDLPKGMLIEPNQINNFRPEEVVILCTGSQGEPLAALTRIAQGSHRQIKILPGDTVVFSASPIPGNDVHVYRSIDLLFRAGANVIYGSQMDIHASGHGSQEDLKMMLNFIKPKYFIPIHGEYRMLVQHSKLAQEVGIPSENIFLLDIGDVVRLNKADGSSYISRVERNHGSKNPTIPSGSVLIDGSGVGDIGNIVLRDRNRFAEDGVMIVVLSVDMKNRKLLAGPDLVTRGFVYVRESEGLLREAKQLVEKLTNRLFAEKVMSWAEWKSEITNVLTPFFLSKTNRSPMIMPIMMETEMKLNPSNENSTTS